MKKTYLGNPKLKAENVRIDFTPEQAQEFIRCSEDPVYFAANYMKIVHLDHGVIPAVPFKYQEEILESLVANRFTIVKASRQVGKCLAYQTTVRLRKQTDGETIVCSVGELYEGLSKKHENDSNC